VLYVKQTTDNEGFTPTTAGRVPMFSVFETDKQRVEHADDVYIPAGCSGSNSRHSDGEFDTHNYVFVCVFQLV